MVAFSLSMIFCRSECALIDFLMRLAPGNVASPLRAMINVLLINCRAKYWLTINGRDACCLLSMLRNRSGPTLAFTQRYGARVKIGRRQRAHRQLHYRYCVYRYKYENVSKYLVFVTRFAPVFVSRLIYGLLDSIYFVNVTAMQ